MEIRQAYGYDSDKVSEDTGLECKDVTLAQQHQADEADINTIVRRFGVTGQLPEPVRAPTFGDFTDVFDFRSAQDAILEANRSFMAMPADVRARFGNNPQFFVEFCSDPANLPELRKLGLAIAEVVAPTVVPAVPPVV